MTRDAVCFILFLFCFVRPDKTFFRQDFAMTKIIKWKKHLSVKTSKFTTEVVHRIWLRVLWLMCNTSELTGDEKKQKQSEYLESTSTQFFFQKLPYILHPLNELDRKMKVYSIYDIHDWYPETQCSDVWPRMTDQARTEDKVSAPLASSLECLYLHGACAPKQINSIFSTMSDQQTLSVFYKKRTTNTKNIKLTVVQKDF